MSEDIDNLRKQNDVLRAALQQCRGAIYGYRSTNNLHPDSVLWKAHDAAVKALADQPEVKCKMCGEPIHYTGKYWEHIGPTPRHPAIPLC